MRIAEGDETAFSRFYEHYYAIIFPFVTRNAPSPEACKDIIQMTFLRVWLNRHKLEEIEHIKAWMIRIASREYLTYVRDHLSKQLQSRELVEDQLAALSAYNTAHHYTLKEIRSLVAEAVEKLSPQRKMVFQLSRNENLSIREIADRLQLAPKTVKNTLTAALAEVRTHLQTNGYDLALIGYLSAVHFF